MSPATLRTPAALLSACALLLGATACHQTAEGLDKRFLVEASVQTLDFGTVTLPDTSPVQTVTLMNTGRRAVTLGPVTAEALGVDAPTFQFLPQDSNCTTGRVLEPGQGCVLAFTFTPDLNVATTNPIEVTWRSVRERDHREETFSRTLVLRGEGDVDCTADPAWTAAWEAGREEALEVNAAQHERGYEAGMALGFGDGHRRGYDDAYTSAYDAAYRQAYDRAWERAWDTGYLDGRTIYADTVGACGDGADQGWVDGSAVGAADGRVDGTDHGFEDGDLDGYHEAWDLLEEAEGWNGIVGGCDEAYAWLYGAYATRAAAPQPPSPDQDRIAGLCEDEGFAAHRDADAYDVGYAAGLADNGDYQAGLRQGAVDGQAEGRADGARQGTDQGHADGYDAGADEGAADAEQQAWDRCYDSGWDDGWASAYDAAYVEHYWAAYDAAHVDAFGAVMDGYYVDVDCETVLFGH